MAAEYQYLTSLTVLWGAVVVHVLGVGFVCGVLEGCGYVWNDTAGPTSGFLFALAWPLAVPVWLAMMCGRLSVQAGRGAIQQAQQARQAATRTLTYDHTRSGDITFTRGHWDLLKTQSEWILRPREEEIKKA